MIVADSNPFIGLAPVSQVHLIGAVHGSVVTPPAVAREIAPEPTLPALNVLPWLSVSEPVDTALARQLMRESKLHAGEAAAILLAERLGLSLMIDELHGRAIARRRGIPIIGVAGLLVRAKDMGLIPVVEPELGELRPHGFRLSDRIVLEALRLAGER